MWLNILDIGYYMYAGKRKEMMLTCMTYYGYITM